MKTGLAILAAAALSAGVAAGGEVRVWADAGWGAALSEAAEGFRAQTGQRVEVTLGGDELLDRLLGGETADVFVPGGEAATERLKAEGKASGVCRAVVVKGRGGEEGRDPEYVSATVPAASRNRTGGKLFVDYLSGDAGQRIWRKHGFETP